MNPKYLQSEELVAYWSALSAAMWKDGRVASYTVQGQSVTKRFLDRRELENASHAIAREIHYRKNEGDPLICGNARFDRFEPWERPKRERLGSFAA